MSLSIALTKGRLEKQTVGMLEECGYGIESLKNKGRALVFPCLLYTSPSPRDSILSRMPSSA